jgi:hypothetical protein
MTAAMDGDDIAVAAAALIVIFHAPPKIRARQWIAQREEKGAYHALLQKLIEEDPKALKVFVHMSHAHFQQITAIVSPLIRCMDTPMRLCNKLLSSK